MRKSILLTLIMIFAGLTSFTSVAAQDLIYVAVDPCRIVDTRNAGDPLSTNTSRNFLVSGTLGELAVQGGTTDCLAPRARSKPLAISAYVLAIGPVSTGGVLTAYPSDQLPPAVGAGSTVNFAAGQVIGNTTNITLCDPAGTCPVDGEFAILARTTNLINVVVDVQGYFYAAALGECPASATTRFVDNGDGTICDSQTGLMWEKKDAADGVADLSNPHDVDNTYSWTSTGSPIYPPDGTAFTDFVARLNNTVASSAADVPFAGHTDWRLSTSAELQAIVDCGFGRVCIDPIFAPTTAQLYWSSTSSSTSTSLAAWGVNFANGLVVVENKLFARRVRAVRGGR